MNDNKICVGIPRVSQNFIQKIVKTTKLFENNPRSSFK
jgi:hypothetical protein